MGPASYWGVRIPIPLIANSEDCTNLRRRSCQQRLQVVGHTRIGPVSPRSEPPSEPNEFLPMTHGFLSASVPTRNGAHPAGLSQRWGQASQNLFLVQFALASVYWRIREQHPQKTA